MGELFPGLAARMAGRGPWWYAEFMQPWAKAANITMWQRTNHYARSERGVMRTIKRAGQPGYRILAPWLVDRTFMTDGHQLKLLLVGYSNEELGDVLEGEVAEGPNGVSRLQRVHREIGAEPATVADGTPAAQERLHALNHVVVTGVDPVQGEGVTAQEVSGADYRVWALSVRNEQGEAQRRGANQAYSDALAALADRHTRTGRYQAAIAKTAEKLAPIRLQHRPPGWKRAAEGGVAVIDRDTHARANLGMRGVYATCGANDIIPGYVPADQDEEEESDEEDDDEENGERKTTRRRTARRAATAMRAGGGDEEGVDEKGDAILVRARLLGTAAMTYAEAALEARASREDSDAF
ncbi:hypothetical protein JKP88DRAFT_280449 [Tribonema minus]|uniref:Uncharacterized protein n=1 Tax=Tribonema minus TaxID=303371 RepID=A0A836CB87_9STRA|nr:hypothetical protein JKP88DRAFT_280449 [Tribonema minus]